MNINYSSKFCIAPMFKYTDKFCNYFHRQLTRKSFLYTEMITTKRFLNVQRKKINKEIYSPIAIQLAGNNIKELVKCSILSYNQGYDEININLGCPSKSAKFGLFGVFLMKQTSLVINMIQSINNYIPIPISVKTRIGIDDKNNYEFLNNFINEISTKTCCTKFIVHARNAFTNIISPKKNRSLPPLQHNIIYKIKKNFPHLNIITNGGISSIKESLFHLKKVDGVMLGETVYKNPSILLQVDKKIFNTPSNFSMNKIQVITNMYPYIENKLYNKIPLHKITRHMLGFFQGEKGSKEWKNYLSQESRKKNANINTLKKAISFIKIKSM